MNGQLRMRVLIEVDGRRYGYDHEIPHRDLREMGVGMPAPMAGDLAMIELYRRAQDFRTRAADRISSQIGFALVDAMAQEDGR